MTDQPTFHSDRPTPSLARLCSAAGKTRQTLAWPLLRAGALGLLLLQVAGLTGCSTAPAPQPAPKQVVLDYGNGWYHPASGTETISQIARYYQREPELVAKLNRTTAHAVPAKGAMLYVPPVNDVERLRPILAKVQAHPELIPRTPWDRQLPPAPVKMANSEIKRKLGQGQLVEEEAGGGWLFWRRKKTSKPVQVVQPAPKPAPRPWDQGKLQMPVQGQVVTGFKSGWQKACHGIEIAAADGTPVRAAAPGKVLMARSSTVGYGNLIVIDHGNSIVTSYGYNREILVKEGQRVSAGQQIASVGRPSRGSASKLFFQVRSKGLPVDPLQYVSN